eukprot:gene1590-1930_t
MEEQEIEYSKITRATIQKVLDMASCAGVLDPVTQKRMDFTAFELEDGSHVTGVRGITPWEARVTTLEGHSQSLVRAFEGDATETIVKELKEHHHSNVQVLPVRQLVSIDGKQREVDGVVVTDDCGVVIEAKTELDDTAVDQLASCLQFIKENQLKGQAAELKKKKKLIGVLAGQTFTSNPGKQKALVEGCQSNGFSILASSGRSLSVGNSRVPHLRVDCCMRIRASGGVRCAMRVAR